MKLLGCKQSGRGAGLRRVAKTAGVPPLVVGALLVTASPAFAFVTPLSSAAFTTDSEPASWTTPAVGSNGACLTAGPSTTQSSIPDCNPTIDSAGSGALRLTTNANDLVGSVFYSVSLPTSQGLDVSFNTYQYDGSGADGISFGLAATNPADPTAPASAGALGGALGYSTNGSTAGVPYGYLGLALDVYGNFENSAYGGSSCTVPSGLTAGTAYPESVTARGPGDGTTGYCILGTTASTYQHGNGGGSGGDTISNLGTTQGSGGYYLDKQSATSRSGLAVPVEIVINPSASAATAQTSLLSVPAHSWFIAYEPLGASSWQSISGALPTTSNNTVLANDFPSGWIDPTTGIPYQLTFGWTSSTGGSTEIHEVTGLGAQSLNGPIPVLAVGNVDNESSEFLAGNQAIYTLSPSVALDAGNGGSESSELTLTDTFPTGITPGTASAPSDWSCLTASQVVTCTYTPSAAIAAGTSLPNVTIPVTVSSGASGPLSAVARLSSIDGDPATATDTATVTSLTASPSPAATSYGNAVSLAAAGIPAAATGTVTFSSALTTLCSVNLPTLSCSTSSSLSPATYPVTATYSGDANYNGATANTSFTIDKSSAYSMTASANPSSTNYGNSVSLSVAGLPGGATGTVSFKSAATSLCSVILPALSCNTSATLGAAAYPVTATYSGDANYNGATAGTSFTITKASTAMTASANPSSTTYANSVSVSVAGLPAGATGTITFKSGTTTLCTATMPALSCNTSAMLDAATYPVTATYSGDANYSGTTAATSFAITKSSAYSMTAAANPSSTNYGNSVSLSVSGLPSAATGTVTFESGTTTLCATSLPALSCNTSATLGAASYPVTATYSGDANYNGATAGTSFTINKTSTAMTAAANPSSTTYSNSVSLSDSGLPSDATGTVTFVSGTQTLCSVSLPALSCNTSSSLSPAIYPVTATYSGDANYNGSTASTSFTINKALTAMTASANPTSTTYGNSVSLSVSGLAPGATGTVTFKSGTTTLCSASLPTSSCNTSSSLSPATYPVTATYSGDANYAGATASTSFAINKSSGYSMTASANPSSTSYGNSVSLSVSGLPVGATGTVTFSSGTTTICSASLPTLSCNTSTVLGAATYPVTATYSGDANYIGATASTSFSVNKFAGYSMSASAAPSSTPHGNSVALLASGLPAQATGSVSFTSGTTTLCSASVLSGAASCPTQSTLAAGSYPVTATYSGDANFVGSSAGTSFTISKSSGYSMTAAANPGSTSYGNSVSLTASGLPGDATGTVSFTSGTTTLCSASLPALSCNTSPTLSAARYPVTASYSGDANYNGATASTSFAITKSSAYSMTASASPGSASYGNSVSVSAAGLPADATGTITFASGTELLCTASLPALSCNTSAVLGAAAYPVTATYSGDANYNGASASTSFVITTSSTYAMTASANPGSTSYGHRVVLSVSGLPGDATGTVMFNSGTTWLCTASLPTLSCDSAATLGAAKYNVIATYSGDANYEGSQAETSFAITKSSGFSMTAAADPASTPYGNAVLLSVAGLPGDATGTVRFSSGTTTLCSASLPALSCDTSAKLDVDSYGVTASYSGNANYVGASAGTGFTVTRLDFTMSASTSDPTTYDHPVVLYVSGVPADATGQVTFRSGTTILCEASLPARSCDTSASLAVGAYGVTATYSGDPRYAGTSAVTSFSIAKVLVDTMTASATPSLARFGATVTLSAKGLPVRATGAVAFKWRSVVLCSSAVSRGGASCSPAKSLEVRRYGVVATYGGDKDDAPAEAKTSFTLIRLLSVMRAKASPATAPFGHHVELWAIGLSSRASGSIKFTEAGVLLCTATLPSVSCEAPSNLASNHYAVTASYSGSSDFSAATAHTAFSVRARVAASDVTLYTSVGRPVSTGLPVPFGTGPFSLELVGRSIQPDGTCTMTRSGRFRFVPAPRFVGTASCSYVVHSPDGATSAPASVKIFVTSAGSAIPPAHTGEPWAGSLYWRLVGMIALGGAALIMLGFRRRRGLRRV